MPTSEAKRKANQANSSKSCGPKTQEGKDRSRANALKHGITATVLVPESAEVLQQACSEFYWALKPQDGFQGWIVSKLAVVSLRIDRCERIERRVRERRRLRAEVAWDDERSLEAESTASKLATRPGEAVAALRLTPHGCRWLMARWAALARSAAGSGDEWTPDLARRASELLGRPEAEWDANPPVVEEGPSPSPSALAAREVEALRDRLESADDLDEVDRHLAAVDLDDEDAELRKVRRYERMLYARVDWCLRQLDRKSPHHSPHPDLAPKWTSAAPARVVEPEKPIEPKRDEKGVIRNAYAFKPPHAPFDLLPEEVPALGEPIDFDAILAARKAKEAARVEEVRRKKRRKLDDLKS